MWNHGGNETEFRSHFATSMNLPVMPTPGTHEAARSPHSLFVLGSTGVDTPG